MCHFEKFHIFRHRFNKIYYSGLYSSGFLRVHVNVFTSPVSHIRIHITVISVLIILNNVSMKILVDLLLNVIDKFSGIRFFERIDFADAVSIYLKCKMLFIKKCFLFRAIVGGQLFIKIDYWFLLIQK